MLHELFSSISQAELGIAVMLFFFGFFSVMLLRVNSAENRRKFAKIAQYPLDDESSHE